MRHWTVRFRCHRYSWCHIRSVWSVFVLLSQRPIKLTQKLTIMPNVMASCCTATSDPRISGGAYSVRSSPKSNRANPLTNSALYKGTIIDKLPTPNPVTKRPAKTKSLFCVQACTITPTQNTTTATRTVSRRPSASAIYPLIRVPIHAPSSKIEVNMPCSMPSFAAYCCVCAVSDKNLGSDKMKTYRGFKRLHGQDLREHSLVIYHTTISIHRNEPQSKHSHPYTNPPNDANNPIADVFLLLINPQIPLLLASSARLADTAVSPGTGAIIQREIEEGMEQRGIGIGESQREDAPFYYAEINLASPTLSPRGRADQASWLSPRDFSRRGTG